MRTRTRLRIAALVTGILVLTVSVLALGGCGSEPAAQSYSDPDFGFSFEYPGDWQLVESDGADINTGADPAKVITVGDPEGASSGDTGLDLFMVRVYELTQVVDEDSMPQVKPILEELLAGYAGQDPTYQPEGELTQTTVNGVPGYEVTATFEWDDGTPMRTTFYFLFAGDVEYQLVLQASEDTWEADHAVFDGFVSSFRP